MRMVPLKACILAVATLCACVCAQAQGTVQVYGRVDGGVDITRAGKSGWQKRVISSGLNGSRVGFTGSEDLGDGLSAIFRIVMGLNLDDGTLAQGGRGFGRESIVGLSSRKLGTVQFGRVETPAYRAHITVDAFQFGTAGAAEITRSAATSSGQLMPLGNNARVDNSISYISPQLAGFTTYGLVAAGEGSAQIGRAYDVSVRYQNGPIDAIAEVGQQNGAGNASSNGKVTSTLVGGSYDFKVAKVLAAYTIEKNSCTTCTGTLARMPGVTGTNTSEFRLAQVGVRVPVGAAILIAQYIRVDDRSQYAVPTGNRDTNWFAVGSEYYLSKRTLIYATVGTLTNHNGSLYALGTGSAQQPANTVGPNDPRTTTMSLGINHSF